MTSPRAKPALPNLRVLVAPVCLLMAAVVFAVNAPGFLDRTNLVELLGQMAPLGIVALGQMIVLITGKFDISVGAVAALAAVAAVTATNALGPIGLVAGPLVGLGCGVVNGWLVGTLGVQPVIATLGMLSAARGLALSISDGEVVPFRDGNPLADLGYGHVATVPAAFVVLAVVWLGVALLLGRTKGGRRFYMIGSAGGAARLLGVSERSTVGLAFAISGALAGVAALVFVARAGAGLPGEADGLELQAIAAAVIGGTALSGGVGRPALVILGALFIQSLSNGLDFTGTSPYLQNLILGGAIVLAGLIDYAARALARRQDLKELVTT